MFMLKSCNVKEVIYAGVGGGWVGRLVHFFHIQHCVWGKNKWELRIIYIISNIHNYTHRGNLCAYYLTV